MKRSWLSRSFLSKNYDALQTLGEHEKVDGFVICTVNKLPNVKSNLVRTDEDWEEELS